MIATKQGINDRFMIDFNIELKNRVEKEVSGKYAKVRREMSTEMDSSMKECVAAHVCFQHCRT